MCSLVAGFAPYSCQPSSRRTKPVFHFLLLFFFPVYLCAISLSALFVLPRRPPNDLSHGDLEVDVAVFLAGTLRARAPSSSSSFVAAKVKTTSFKALFLLVPEKRVI